MVEISVIIPTYNVEKYIRECLDSAINQTFDDIEIICIDDNSTDRTLDILNEYALKDSRIRVYQNDENKGIAYTRNLSLTLANGKYIYFLDSDDFIELFALERLYNLVEEKSLDIIIFKLLNFKNHSRRKFKIPYTEMYYLERRIGDRIFNLNDVIDLASEICVNLQGKLFRRDLIQDIEFPNGYIFEDYPFFFEALIKAKRVYFLREHLCLKRDRKGSIITTHNEKYLDFIDMMFYTIDIAKKYEKYDELKPYLFQHMIRFNLYQLVKLNPRISQLYFKKMKREYILHKNEIEEVYDDLYYKYQLTFNACLKSDNYITFLIRICYLFLKNIKQTFREMKTERKMWKP